MAHMKIYGLLKSETFHIAKCCAEDLHRKFPDKFQEPFIKPMLECEWYQFVEEKKIEIGGDTWAYTDLVMCFVNENSVGNHKELLQWAQDEFNYEDFRPESLYAAMAQEAYTDYFINSERHFTYMDINIDGARAGQLLFELMSDICPKTCENFRALCTGEKGALPSGLNLTYENSQIHRIVPNGWIQGGDILHGRGDAGECIYGGVFEDENFAIPHSSRGILGMANKGRHTNASQFYITLEPTPWMDCTYVAFGKVVEGTELLKRIENMSTFNERPKVECRIASCGEFIPID
uniref:LOW QUALITY PROTEIN: probable inactive peptidyl-prolyl cis-trans isomerase-like 6 n=1 Tax=Styela clava TaxID=7725 RepID=UPI00193A687B|nr:LOW QUALITY PROTEIN: probable inactive peptidyl-prolyl cis-trans isomerase-like 6 [Styela clava]